MQITLIIHLRDHEGSSHKKAVIELSNEVTMKQLLKRISSLWRINEEYIELFSNGQDILYPNFTLQQIGIKDNDEIIVKHSLLQNWAQFDKWFAMAESAQRSRKEHTVKDCVDRAILHSKLLDQTNFFLIYPVYDGKFLKFKNEFAHYVDADTKYIEDAAHVYFLNLLNEDPGCPVVKTECNRKPRENSGAQGGIVCRVMKNGVEFGIFHVKIHLDISTQSSNHQHADLRELFVYRLLKLINVGPEVHFLPNVHHSRFGLYIATKDVPGFRRAVDTTMDDVQMSQLDLLRHLFYLTDLHSANYGVDGDGKLSVVDFQISHHTRSAKVEEYLKKNKALRIKIGKECFEQWEFPKKVDDADDAIISQKKFFRDRCINLKTSEAYEEYLTQVKNNIAAFATSFD